MAKKLNVVGDVASFGMTVSGGDLPKEYKAEITVEIDYSGMDRSQLIEIASGGQSLRVALQGQLRKKRTIELNQLVENGLKVLATDVVKGNVTKPVDKLLALSKEDFIASLADLGIESEQATVIYNTKHGIENNN